MLSTFQTAITDPKTGRIRLSSDAERSRRLKALREEMRSRDLKALVVCGRSDLRFRGRVVYVSDVFQFTADCFVVLTLEGPPVFISTPVVGLGQAMLTGWAEDFRADDEPGREIGKVLSEHGLGEAAIGIVGLSDAIAHVHLQQIEKAVPSVRLTDATSLFEDVRQVKSPEEINNLRHTSAIFRKLFGALEAEIRPGVQESDIAGAASRICKLHGCRDVKAAMGSTPFTAVSYGSTKRIERDDLLMVWIETPGPTGYWLELRRSYSFGPPPETVRRFWSVIESCWDRALSLMRPGAFPGDVLGAVATVLRNHGYGLSDAHYSIHGIGLDAIEGMWAPGNDRLLRENEVISFHPAVTFPDEKEALGLRFLGMTDNVLVTPSGGQRMTYDRDRIVEL